MRKTDAYYYYDPTTLISNRLDKSSYKNIITKSNNRKHRTTTSSNKPPWFQRTTSTTQKPNSRERKHEQKNTESRKHVQTTLSLAFRRTLLCGGKWRRYNGHWKPSALQWLETFEIDWNVFFLGTVGTFWVSFEHLLVAFQYDTQLPCCTFWQIWYVYIACFLRPGCSCLKQISYRKTLVRGLCFLRIQGLAPDATTQVRFFEWVGWVNQFYQCESSKKFWMFLENS